MVVGGGARCFALLLREPTGVAWLSGAFQLAGANIISRPNCWGVVYSCVLFVYLLSCLFVFTEVPNCQSSFWKAERFYQDNTESKLWLFCHLVFYTVQFFCDAEHFWSNVNTQSCTLYFLDWTQCHTVKYSLSFVSRLLFWQRTAVVRRWYLRRPGKTRG